MSRVVTRIAPSPTGSFHIGTLRTALINYVYAKKHKGLFLVRIEDTDEARSEAVYEKDIFETLDWIGIKPDKTYKQSERKSIYKEKIKELIENGSAYISEEASKKDASKTVKVVRFKNKETCVGFKDELRGNIQTDVSSLGDFVIAKDLKSPLYNLSVVIDDIDMEITHVFRGDDHIANTARQVLLYNAFNKKPPVFIHLPLIHNSRGGKLSKRDGAVSVGDFRRQGYLRRTLINYITLLGWRESNEDNEMYTLEDLIKVFSIKGLQKKEARFDIKKLDWFNKQYLASLSPKAQQKLFKKYVSLSQVDIFENISGISKYVYRVRLNLSLFDRKLNTFMRNLFADAHLNDSILQALKDKKYNFYLSLENLDIDAFKKENLDTDNVRKHLGVVKHIINEADIEDAEKLREQVYDYAKDFKKKEVLFPLRFSLTSLSKGPECFNVIRVLGKAESIKRINRLIELL